MKVVTYGDVAGAIARAGLARGPVAKVMGYTESQFSGVLKDREGRPSKQFVAALQDAIDAVQQGHPTG